MIESDSSKVIEKLTELLDLLKTKETTKEVAKEATKEVAKEVVKETEVKCDKCDKCPLRKIMTNAEFEEFGKIAEKMKKEDFVQMCSKEECTTCPFMNEEQTSTKKDLCYGFVSFIFFILFLVVLFRTIGTIKGLYCTT